MARRKHEVQLQQEIETTEEWEELMAKEGLFVIDVYQEWCGPCSGLVANFRRLKNEIGDDLLHFAVAKADTIEALEKYRGRCEPCFLFYAGGVLVAVIHGARAPELQRTITEQLKQEHKVQEGTAERREVRDPIIAAMEDAEKDKMEEERKKEEELTGFTVALIKPDAVKAGKVDEIIQQMEEAGIEIMAKDERQLTEEEARKFYAHLEGEDYFEDLVKFMISGPTFALVLTKGQSGDDVIQEWRNMLGPPTVEKAKEEAPDSLRAKYGSEKFMNALHGSDSPETAARELAFFFPSMAVTPPSSGKSQKPQRTLALIRPDAFRKHRDEILQKIKEAGFKVALQKEMTLTKEQAEDFYKEHRDKPYFEELTTRMSSGPLMALGLAREDAVKGWREMLGPPEVEEAKKEAPDSLRAMFSDDMAINPLHGSDSEEAAEKELHYFFPVEQTVAVIKPDAIGTKEKIINKIHEAGFRIAARKETKITREIAEEFYAEHKDKDYFNDLVEHMVSGPTMFMVLSREDAVTGWRETIGPTDPELAKTEAPDTIRAQFGENILKNAVHGSSNPDHARSSIDKVFGPLEFDADEKPEDKEHKEEAAKTAESDQEKPAEPKEGEQPAEGEAKEGAEPTEEPKEGAEPTEPKEGAKTTEEPKEGAEPSEKPKEGAETAEEPKEGAETGGEQQQVEEPPLSDVPKDEGETPAEPKEGGEPAKTPETKEPSQPTKSPETKEPSERTKTPETKEPSERTKTPETKEPSERTKTPETKEPSEPAKSPETKEPSEPAKTPETKEPSEPAKSPETKEPSEPAKSPETKEPSEPAKTPETKESPEAGGDNKPEAGGENKAEEKESTEQKEETAEQKPEEKKGDEEKKEGGQEEQKQTESGSQEAAAS